MKNIIATILAIAAGLNWAAAQSSVSSVSYNKSTQPALMLQLPYDEELSEGFILTNLKKTGYDAETKGRLFWKQNKVNDFYVFKDVRFEGVGQPVNLYFKVEAKGGSQPESAVYLLVSKGNESFVSFNADQDVYNAASKFMNSFVEQSAAYKLDVDIKKGEAAVQDSQKKMSKLQETENDLNKKIKELQDALHKNKMEQQAEGRQIVAQESEIAVLKTKARN
jgi:hypothetical protein